MGLLRVPYKMLSAPAPLPSLSKENSILLLVDMQFFTTDRSQGLGKLANERGIDRELDEYFLQVKAALINSKKLVTACRSYNIPIIHTILNCSQLNRKDLSRQLRVSNFPIPIGDAQEEICPEVKPQIGELVLPRVTYSPFTSTDLLSILSDMKVDTIIVAGMMANITVWMIAREASDRDFGVVVVIDACASETLDWHIQFRDGIVGGLICQRSSANVIEMLQGNRS